MVLRGDDLGGREGQWLWLSEVVVLVRGTIVLADAALACTHTHTHTHRARTGKDTNVIYPSNGIPFNNKKKRSPDTCYSIDEPKNHDAK